MKASFLHPLADVQTQRVGAGTTVWQFVVVLGGALIGKNVNICSHCFIENDVVIGNDVTVKNGVHLWDGLRVEDGVFIGPAVTFANDKFPRSKNRPKAFETTTVRRGASIGANATILPGVNIGAGAMIGAGAVVTRSVPEFAIVVGNPATIIGYTNTARSGVSGKGAHTGIRPETSHPSSLIYDLPVIPDIRGKLTVGEFDDNLPFQPKRYFIVYDVPSRETRGEHAHRACHQLLICVRGSCVAVADDGQTRQEFLLDSPNRALHMPPMIWGTQYKYSSDAMLLVFASHHYDPKDYIRDYDIFLSELADQK